MKLIVDITSAKQIAYLKECENIEIITVGIKNFSLSAPTTFELNEAKELIRKIKKIKRLVCLNLERIYCDQELEKLKSLIDEIGVDNFDYASYSDLGVQVLFKELGIENRLIYRAPTYMTNYPDINLYGNFNKYIVASNQISISELLEIDKNVKKQIIIDGFGEDQIFYSRRPLLSNFYKYRGVNPTEFDSSFYLVEETRSDILPIIQDETGTHVFEQKHYALVSELKNLVHTDYVWIHANFLTRQQQEVVNLAYNQFVDDFDEVSLNNKFALAEIETYKGAYSINSVLTKKEANNE